MTEEVYENYVKILNLSKKNLTALKLKKLQRRDQQQLHAQLLQQIRNYVKLIIKGLNEMEELKKFQSSTFDTITRRRLVEDQDTILELTGKIQDLQNEIHCVNDSKDFQDAESIRSGNSHVTNRPVFFPTCPKSWSNAKPFCRNAEPQRRSAKHLGHTWYIGKRFCKSRCVIFSTLSAGIESMEFRKRRAASLINSGEE